MLPVDDATTQSQLRREIPIADESSDSAASETTGRSIVGVSLVTANSNRRHKKVQIW